ncbi:hypothetical protein [Deinococcus multiflagellatus]|uniref:Uncharacterized protein n=1 Tax=Deinococcus multiflagellatus TaxID=1656887 RepID=A0ABW1ZS66_9DEIO|nr:hypothetical protein [Deinococcus multiflagellatus]MBZ9714490.1 hypothetical protein [Deinococcus multiflagellatus]
MTTATHDTCADPPPMAPAAPQQLAEELRRQADADRNQAAQLDLQAAALYATLGRQPEPRYTAQNRVAYHLIEGAAQLRQLAQTRLTLAAHLDTLSPTSQEPS